MAIELTIEKLIYGGDGLARVAAGDRAKSVFVPFALTGERIAAEVIEDKKSYARANPLRILQPSADRVTPQCEYFGRCGGCQYQHASYEAQLQAKQAILTESLQRTAGIRLESPLGIVPSPEPFGYRNRTRLHVRHTPDFALGYYRAGSHDLLPITHCPISSPLLNRAIAALLRTQLPPLVQEVEIFADHDDARCMIELYVGGARPSDNELQSFAEALEEALPECAGIHVFAQSTPERARIPVLQQIASAGAPALDYQVLDHSYRVSAGSFFQVNRHLVRQLLTLATDGVSGRRAFDLYAGVGLFTLPLARAFEDVVAVEAAPFSYADLDANLPAKTRRHCQTTESFLRHRGEEVLAPELALVDPPRSGIGVDGAKLLAALLPLEIRYVSCDPVTLARDLKVLLESGYRIREAYLVDMFPQTMHIESFVRLTSSRHE